MKERSVVGPALTAVVTGENDQRVVRDPSSLQLRHDHAHTFVDLLHHRGIDRTTAIIHIRLGHSGFWTAWRLKRCMNGKMRHIAEERALGGSMAFHKGHSTLVDEVSEVALLLDWLQAFSRRAGVPS